MKYLEISDWNGGLSDSSRLGLAGSFRFGQGLNYKDDLSSITANKAAVLNSTTIVTDLPKWITSYGAIVYAYGSGGKFYKSGTPWVLARTVANSTGQGMDLYSGVIYYRQNTQIGTYTIATTTFVDNWKAAGDSVQTLADWGAVKSFRNFISFANARYLAVWDGATWDYDRVILPPGHYIRDLGTMDEYLVMAVNDAETITQAKKGYLFFWDGTSSTYNFFVEMIEPVSSIQANQNSLFAFGGSGSGNIYKIIGSQAIKIKRLPYVGDGKTIYVYPGADSNFRGMCHFGVAGGNSATAYREVYAWGSPSKDYPDALNIEYPISTGTVKTTDVDIGAVKAIGNLLYIGWKDDTDYGIDLVSTTINQLSVTWESRIHSLTKLGTFRGFRLFFEPLASNETLTLKYKADHQSSWQTIGTATHTNDGAITHKFFNRFGSVIKAMDIQFQVTLGGTTTMPTVYKVLAEYDEITVPIIILGQGGGPVDFELLATSTGATSATLESPIVTLSKLGTFKGFRLFCETLVSGDSITLKYKADQQGSWQTIGTATYSSDGAITHKFFSKFASFVKTMDIQFQLTLAGTSVVPVVVKLLAEYEQVTLPIAVSTKGEKGDIVDSELLSTSTGKTAATFESPIIELARQTAFTRFKLYFEKLVSGDSITLNYDADRAGSWTEIGTATYTSDGGVTFKLLNEEFRATDIQYQIVLAGTSAVPVLTKLVIESKPEGAL